MSNFIGTKFIVKYVAMKFVGLLLFVSIFLIAPLLMLQLVVMPALDQLKYTYQNADTVTQTILHK